MLPKRHHLLLAGLLLFFAGIQFRVVQSFTLNERSSTFVAARMGAGPQAAVWPELAGDGAVGAARRAPFV